MPVSQILKVWTVILCCNDMCVDDDVAPYLTHQRSLFKLFPRTFLAKGTWGRFWLLTSFSFTLVICTCCMLC